MSNMIGDWKLDPSLTTGRDEFLKAMGMAGAPVVVYTFHLRRDGDEWHMKIDTENAGTWIDLKFQMGVPFKYKGVDNETNLTSVINLENDHFIEQMTSEKDGVITHWMTDTYRHGNYVYATQTKDGNTIVEHLKKVD